MSSRCCLKDFTARRRRTNSENKKGKERRGTGGRGKGGARSGLQLELLKLHLFYSYFTSLGFFPLPFYPPPIILLPHSMFSHPSLSSHSVHPPTHPTSLFMLALSPSIWWNSAADNACNWSDSHFSSVFGPDKEYCQHFADMASAGRIKWTLFCSVCSKLKASQFICSRLRLTGASYSLKKKKKKHSGDGGV